MSDLYFSALSTDMGFLLHQTEKGKVINEVTILHLLRSVLEQVKMAVEFGGLNLSDCEKIELAITLGRKEDAKPMKKVEL